jgi:hypothetical protein
VSCPVLRNNKNQLKTYFGFRNTENSTNWPAFCTHLGLKYPNRALIGSSEIQPVWIHSGCFSHNGVQISGHFVLFWLTREPKKYFQSMDDTLLTRGICNQTRAAAAIG